MRERADDIIDMDKAVRRVEAERHHQLPGSAHEVPVQTRPIFHRKCWCPGPGAHPVIGLPRHWPCNCILSKMLLLVCRTQHDEA